MLFEAMTKKPLIITNRSALDCCDRRKKTVRALQGLNLRALN